MTRSAEWQSVQKFLEVTLVSKIWPPTFNSFPLSETGNLFQLEKYLSRNMWQSPVAVGNEENEMPTLLHFMVCLNLTSL